MDRTPTPTGPRTKATRSIAPPSTLGGAAPPPPADTNVVTPPHRTAVPQATSNTATTTGDNVNLVDAVVAALKSLMAASLKAATDAAMAVLESSMTTTFKLKEAMAALESSLTPINTCMTKMQAEILLDNRESYHKSEDGYNPPGLYDLGGLYDDGYSPPGLYDYGKLVNANGLYNNGGMHDDGYNPPGLYDYGGTLDDG